MTDKEIENVLTSLDLSEIETSITNECDTYVNREFINFTIGILRREITNSGLTLTYLKEKLRSKKDSIIKLGIKILKALKGVPLEEEYPEGEKPSKDEKAVTISSEGIGIGFGIKYAIYLDFLENNPNELVDYIKKERIPFAAKFSKTLKELYNN